MSSFVRSSGGFTFATCGALAESLFATDSDISKTDDQVLSWRDDPHLNQSDWTIIVATSDFNTRTYHVHKSILGDGPRCSKHFRNIFHEQSQHRHQSHTTKIELDEQDADAFPFFLDFVYNVKSQHSSDDDSFTLAKNDDFTTNNAVSLRHLARIFECESLMRAINKFIQRDLSVNTAATYLTLAYQYKDERLVESTKRFCIENFTQLETRALTRLPLPIFRSIVLSVLQPSKSSINRQAEEKESLSHQLSELVCQYFEKHPKSLTVKLLLELTDEKVMPKIASESAIGFTALARDLDPRNIPPNSDEWRGLIALCDRCAKVVVDEYGWKEFNVTSALEEYLYGPCSHESDSKMDSLLFATSFAAALAKAQRDYKSNTKGSSDTKKEISDLQRENSELRAANRAMRKEVERYKQVLGDTKEELSILKRQSKDLGRKNRGSR